MDAYAELSKCCKPETDPVVLHRVLGYANEGALTEAWFELKNWMLPGTRPQIQSIFDYCMAVGDFQ